MNREHVRVSKRKCTVSKRECTGGTEQQLAQALKEIEELKERCRWLDGQVTTLREQRDQLARDGLSR